MPLAKTMQYWATLWQCAVICILLLDHATQGWCRGSSAALLYRVQAHLLTAMACGMSRHQSIMQAKQRSAG